MKKPNKNKTILVSVLFFTSLLLNWNCAKIVPLTGGDKDIKPPVILKSSPDTFSTSFSSKTIQINFDEYISVKNPSTEIFYSPPFKTPPEVIGKGKSILIKIKDTLLANTTYNIRFGNAVADITEGNTATNLEYVFSTGTYIDSGSIRGNIINAFDLSPLKGIKVMLYEPGNDSLPYQKKPLYYCLSDDAGSFILKYLKQGNYRIFAIDEQNNNFIYDRPGEMIAFNPESVKTDTNQLIKLRAFTEIPKKPSVLKARSPFFGKILFEFSGNSQEIDLIPQSNQAAFSDSLFERNENGDSLTVWHKNLEADSIVFFVSKKGVVFDTLSVRIPKKNEMAGNDTKNGRGGGLKKESNSEKFNISSNFIGSKSFNLFKKPELVFSQPISEIDLSKIQLLQDSVTVPFSMDFSDKSKRKMVLNTSLKEGSSYFFKSEKGAFKNYWGKDSDSTSGIFTTRFEKEFGNVSLEIKNPVLNCGIILLLIKGAGEIVQKQYFNPGERLNTEFKRLEPGEYKLRLIYDENNNSKWDTGNYLKKTEPEKVILMSAPIVVRQSWDQSLKWDLQEKGRETKKASK